MVAVYIWLLGAVCFKVVEGGCLYVQACVLFCQLSAGSDVATAECASVLLICLSATRVKDGRALS